QLERRRRQQRVPREAHGDGRRRDAVDRGRGQGEAPGVVLQGHGDPRRSWLSERQRGQDCAEHRRVHPRHDPEGGQERHGGEGVPQALHPAEGRGRVRRARSGPLAAGHAVARQEPILAGPEGPASAGLRPAGPPRPDNAGTLRVQPGDGGSPQPARVERGDDRRGEGGSEAGRGDRQGVQADRRDLREVQDGVRAEMPMMNSASVADISRPTIQRRTLSRSLRGNLKGGEYTWALAFVVPYLAVFITFVAYPVVYAFWLRRYPC